MRAVRFDHYGRVDVLYIAEINRPEPGPGEVLVEVVAAGINPGESKIRDGSLDAVFPATFPSGQGSDFAGRVAELGDGVTEWSEGDEVIGWSDGRNSHADYLAVPADQLTPKPSTVDWDAAGALAVAGKTAFATVRAIAPQDNETVAISSAAGGVGSLAVQLTRLTGAQVVGIASQNNREWLESFGVAPVAYGDGLADRLRTMAPLGIDAFIDTHGDGYVQLAVDVGVRPERVVTVVDYEAAPRLGARVTGGAEANSATVLAQLAELIAAGRLTVPVAATYPLEQVQAAYTELADGHTRGKIVLRMR